MDPAPVCQLRKGGNRAPSVPTCKEGIVRHETKNLQIIVAERFFEPHCINLQQKDDAPGTHVRMRISTLKRRSARSLQASRSRARLARCWSRIGM